MDFVREWAAFAGASSVLMGASLALGARRRAEEGLAWSRQRRQALGLAPGAKDEASFRRHLWIHRAGGLLFVALGAYLLGAASLGRGLPDARETGMERRLYGSVILLLGLGSLAFRIHLRKARAPRFVEACAWALSALWIAFGWRLIRGAAS